MAYGKTARLVHTLQLRLLRNTWGRTTPGWLSVPLSQHQCRTITLPREPHAEKLRCTLELGKLRPGKLRPRRQAGTSPSATTRASANSTRSDALLPHWLPVFHSGTAQIALTSAAKVFAFAFFGFSAAVIAPAFYDVGVAAAANGSSSYLKYLLPAAIITAASLPLYVTTLTSTAMVTYVHIALPPAARRSRSALEAWARRIPRTTHVLITTQRASMNARQTETCMAELSIPLLEKRSSGWFGRAIRAREDVGMGPGGPSTAPDGLKAASSSASSASQVPRNQSDLQILLQRQRLPGWQPPTPKGRLGLFTREPKKFLIRARSNKSKELMVWDRFVEQIGEGG